MTCKNCGCKPKDCDCHGDFMEEELEDTPKVNAEQIEDYLESIEHYCQLIRRRLKMLHEQAEKKAVK